MHSRLKCFKPKRKRKDETQHRKRLVRSCQECYHIIQESATNLVKAIWAGHMFELFLTNAVYLCKEHGQRREAMTRNDCT